MVNKKLLGDRLKELRNKSKKNQETVANEIGISRARYSHYENNHVEPDIELIKKLAEYYMVTIDYLLGNTTYPNPHDDEFNPMNEINELLDKYEIEDSGFFDIEKWKAMGPEEIKQLEEYFEFITSRAKKRNDDSTNS